MSLAPLAEADELRAAEGGRNTGGKRRQSDRSEHARPDRSGLGRLSEIVAIAVVVLAPLPIGSEDRSWIAVWCIGLSASLLVADLRQLRAHQVRVVGGFLVVLASICLVLALQMDPSLTEGLADGGWADAASRLGTAIQPRVSITAANLFFAFGPMILFSLAFCRFAIMPVGGQGVSLALGGIRWAGVCYAVGSAILFLVNPGALLWQEKYFYLQNLTGTFINRNTAATFFGSCSVLWVLAVMRQARDAGLRSELTRAELLNSARKPPASFIVACLCFLACFSATIMTGSRAGFLLSLLMICLAVVLYSERGRQAFWRRGLVLGSVIGCLLILAELWGQTLAVRIGSGGLSDTGRIESYATTLRIVADHPWLGVGLGNFATAFPSYRPNTLGIYGIWDRAHNTILEIAAELGMPIAVLILVYWLWGAVTLVRGYRRRRQGRAYPVAAICVGLLGSLHSLLDFSLQVPGYATVFAAVVATGLGQSASGRDTGSGNTTGAAK